VHDSHLDNLVELFRTAIEEQFGQDVQDNSGLGRMAKESHAARLLDMIQEVESYPDCKVIGGSDKCDVRNRFIYPTLIVSPPGHCRLMREEVFGPILPIIPVKCRADAQEIINSIPGTPLSMYVFTNKDSVFNEMITTCRAGSVVRNDLLIHFGTPHLPMSGMGTSGNGSYRGIYSWRCFTHPQAQVYRPCFSTADFGLLRYHPFGTKKEKLVLLLAKLPAIPPLKTWLFCLTVLLIIFSVEVLRHGLADALFFIAQLLKA
jgi:aldehyde dehydrogenase (NAD+)